MSNKTPAPAKLRALVLQFYSENDPAKLQMGLDVNGIVEWTTRNGIEALNKMLLRQFGKEINLENNQESAQNQFKRMSAALTPELFERTQTFSVQLTNKEAGIRNKLKNFYVEHDPTKLEVTRKDQFDKLVKFAMYHGLKKLNDKLIRKYGIGVDKPDEFDEAQNAQNKTLVANFSSGISQTESPVFIGSPRRKTPPPVPKRHDLPQKNGYNKPSALQEVKMFGTEGALNFSQDVKDLGDNPFGIDRKRLKDDLILFYTELEDEEQIEVVDDVIEWACRIGMKNFNEKMEQMYGNSLDDILSQHKRKLYADEGVARKNKKPSVLNDSQQLDSPEFVEESENEGGNEEKVPLHYNMQNMSERTLQQVDRQEKVKSESLNKSFSDILVESEHSSVRNTPHNDSLELSNTAVKGQSPAKPFKEMSDDEIRAELKAFYTEHDPDNLAKLDQVTALARRLGRDVLNEKLFEIYDDVLKPVVQQQHNVLKSELVKSPTQTSLLSSGSKPPGLGYTTLRDNQRPALNSIQNAFGLQEPPGMNMQNDKSDEEDKMSRLVRKMSNYSANQAQKAAVAANKMQKKVSNVINNLKNSSAKLSQKLGIQSQNIPDEKSNVGSINPNFSTDSMDESSGNQLTKSPLLNVKSNVSTKLKNLSNMFHSTMAAKQGSSEASVNGGKNSAFESTSVVGEPKASTLKSPKLMVRSPVSSFKAFATKWNNQKGQQSESSTQQLAEMPTTQNNFIHKVESVESGLSEMKKKKIGGVSVFETYGGPVVNNPMNEIAVRAKAIQKRNIDGSSLVTGDDGRQTTINILLNCQNYELDIMTGVCTCGFAKNEHSKLAKKHEVNQVLMKKQNELRNSLGLPSVSAIVKNMSNNVRPVKPNFKKSKTALLEKIEKSPQETASFMMLTSEQQRKTMQEAIPEPPIVEFDDDDYI